MKATGRKIIGGILAALAMAFTSSAAPSQMEFTWKMNENASANTIADPAGNLYNGVAYLLYVGNGYNGKQAEVENAFKGASGLDLNNLPSGMELLDQCDIKDGTMSERKVKTHAEVESLSNYWVMAVMFSGEKILCANIQQPTYQATYTMGNTYTKAGGSKWVGPGTVVLPQPSLRVSVSSFNGPYDGSAHGITLDGITGYETGTPKVRYSLDGANYDYTEAQLGAFLPKDVTAEPVRFYVKATLEAGLSRFFGEGANLSRAM